MYKMETYKEWSVDVSLTTGHFSKEEQEKKKGNVTKLHYQLLQVLALWRGNWSCDLRFKGERNE